MINKGTWCARGRPGIFLHLHLLPDRRRLAKSMNLEKPTQKDKKAKRQQMATGQKYEQLEQHPLFKSYFQDDASSPCAGLAVFGCLDLPAWPFHTLSSSVRPGAFHSTLHWESPSSHMITYFCSGLHIFGKSREHNQESCSCVYRPSWGDQVGSSWSGKDFHLLDQIILSRFHPAHMLKDPAMERKGRLWNLDQIFRNVWQYPYKFTASFASPC